MGDHRGRPERRPSPTRIERGARVAQELRRERDSLRARRRLEGQVERERGELRSRRPNRTAIEWSPAVPLRRSVSFPDRTLETVGEGASTPRCADLGGTQGQFRIPGGISACGEETIERCASTEDPRSQ